MPATRNDDMMLPVECIVPLAITTTTINRSIEIDIEVVVLYCGSNGRLYCSHNICGEHVVYGELLRRVQTVVEVESDVIEEAVKVVQIVDGADCCNVGFVPRVQSTLTTVKESLKNVVVVQELYSFSQIRYKRRNWKE
jgi:hypothetical protein